MEIINTPDILGVTGPFPTKYTKKSFSLLIIRKLQNILNFQVIDETLSPTWDETLVFDDVIVYGNKEHLKKDPPSVVIEIFDQDKVGKSEFIGRTLAKPHVTLSDDKYDKPPHLEWFQLYRGGECAGELLAAFEILQVRYLQYGLIDCIGVIYSVA